MPVEVRGLKEARKALQSFSPDLNKNLTKEIRSFLSPVVNSAKGDITTELSGWSASGTAKAFKASGKAEGKGFPKFNKAFARSGIKISFTPTKPNRSGFVSLIRVVNLTASGAIYETAGRKSLDGQPWVGRNGAPSKKTSHSNNPKAGKQFIAALPEMRGEGKMQGRLIYKAWADNQGKAQGRVVLAIERTLKDFQKTMSKGSVIVK
jgi:hypothetical protein